MFKLFPRNQNKPTQDAFKIPLGKELFILLALRWNEDSGVYGLDLAAAIDAYVGKPNAMSHGEFYTLLTRMQRKGLIESRKGGVIYDGIHRHYYSLTKEGLALQKYIDEATNNLWRWRSE
jgi:DNA-binding PadR family transcriptional regulator